MPSLINPDCWLRLTVQELNHVPTELCLSLLYLPVCAGIAGRFTRQQLSDLHKCAGTNGIAYITRDNQVSAAVGCNPTGWQPSWPAQVRVPRMIQVSQHLVLDFNKVLLVDSAVEKPGP